MKKRRIRKIIGIASAIIVSAFVLLFIGLETDLISVYERSDDVEAGISINDIVDRLGVNESVVYEISPLEDVFYEELGIIGWEFIGITEYNFNIENVNAEAYKIYSAIKDGNIPTWYLIPIKDGEEMEHIYEYNEDGSLMLLWTRE